jgi:hypothetical protein
VSRADQAADLLVELMHGRDRTELSAVLEDALDPYGLARLCAVAGSRLGALNGARARREYLVAGILRETERAFGLPDPKNG